MCKSTIPCLYHLKYILEVRSVVTCHPNLLSAHALVHVVPSATGPEPVLTSEHKMHENRATKKADELISYDRAMTLQ